MHHKFVPCYVYAIVLQTNVYRALQRAVRILFSARAMRFITLSAVMRKLTGALIQTVVPVLTVLGFCACSFCHAVCWCSVSHFVLLHTQ